MKSKLKKGDLVLLAAAGAGFTAGAALLRWRSEEQRVSKSASQRADSFGIGLFSK